MLTFVACAVLVLPGLAQRASSTTPLGLVSCTGHREHGSLDTTPDALYCRETSRSGPDLSLATSTGDSGLSATELADGIHICPPLSGEPGTMLSAASDLTFGCKPGSVCDPPKPGGCNLWPKPPSDTYKCPTGHCIEAPVIDYIVSPTGETRANRLSKQYFNLDPRDFGLSFAIFSNAPTQAPGPSLHRRETLPSICFDDCNAAQLIALSTGKTASLCNTGSAFQSAYKGCMDCARDNRVDRLPKNTTTYEPPAFTQYLQFCTHAAIATTTILDVPIFVTTGTIEPSLPLAATPSKVWNGTIWEETPLPDLRQTSGSIRHVVSILCLLFCAFAAYS